MKCPNITCKEISCNHSDFHELNRGCLCDDEGCPSCEPELKYKYFEFRFRKLLTLKSFFVIIILTSILILVNP